MGKRKKKQGANKRPYKEEYGELDRPEPAHVIEEIKDKFVNWDLYKMTVMANLIKSHKRGSTSKQGTRLRH